MFYRILEVILTSTVSVCVIRPGEEVHPVWNPHITNCYKHTVPPEQIYTHIHCTELDAIQHKEDIVSNM